VKKYSSSDRKIVGGGSVRGHLEKPKRRTTVRKEGETSSTVRGGSRQLKSFWMSEVNKGNLVEGRGQIRKKESRVLGRLTKKLPQKKIDKERGSWSSMGAGGSRWGRNWG